MKNLRAFSDYGRCTFLEIVLKTIELTQELFIIDLNYGTEISIPEYLL